MAVLDVFTRPLAVSCSGLSFAVLSVVCACYSPEPPLGAPCIDDTNCPTGQRCIEGFCGGRPANMVDAEPDVPSPPPPDAAVDAPASECITAADCTASNSCKTVACTNNKCVETARADGASCGTSAAQRCCTGKCVNIAADEANCGGCGQQCAAGRTCESVAVTNGCELAPAATTGRCTCAAANAECPDGQICRTVTPYTDRCTPNTVTNCAPGETFVDVNLCPNYCRY